MGRKITEINAQTEEYLKQVIAGDVPPITEEVIESLQKEKDEVKDDELKPTPSEQSDISQTKLKDRFLPESFGLTETKTERDVKKEPKKRGPVRKDNDLDKFEELFLVKRVYSEKRQTYISKDIYQRMMRYIRVITPKVSITTYFDNILMKHLEDYEDVINELYNENTKKPI